MEAPCRKRARLAEEVDVSREKDMGAAIEEEHPSSVEQVTREEEQMVDDWNRPSHARKNKHRCFSCRAKLELVQQQLGLCRCGELTNDICNRNLVNCKMNCLSINLDRPHFIKSLVPFLN